jgi:hypothetical protein
LQGRETEREDEALNRGWLRKRSREDNEKAEDRKDKVNKARRSMEGETILGIGRAVSLL